MIQSARGALERRGGEQLQGSARRLFSCLAPGDVMLGMLVSRELY
jgi:hypothetical protein